MSDLFDQIVAIVNPTANANKCFSQWEKVKDTIPNVTTHYVGAQASSMQKVFKTVLQLHQANHYQGKILLLAVGGDGHLRDCVNGLFMEITTEQDRNLFFFFVVPFGKYFNIEVTNNIFHKRYC